jgi:hypothetical protein
MSKCTKNKNDAFLGFDNGFAAVKVGNKYGYINGREGMLMGGK